MTIVRMPEVATGTGSASIQNWLVAAGDAVRPGQVIVEIETEKAVVDYETELDGVLAATLLDEGASAEVGTPIAVIAVGGQSLEEAIREAGLDTDQPVETPDGDNSLAEPTPAPAPPPASPVSPTAPAAPPAAPAPAPSTAPDDTPRRQFITPIVRRLAREQGLDLSGVVGSGPHGRIVRRDLERLVQEQAQAAAPAQSSVASVQHAPAQPAEYASYTAVPHTGMRRAVARRLAESKATVPHFYLKAECRMDALLDLRTRLNEAGTVRISVNDLVLKATAGALRDVPEANATWTDDAIHQHHHVDIAVAVALPTGLITPVVRRVDTLAIGELSGAVRALAERARGGRLKQHEIEGGSFSVSNLGMYDVEEFAAIINPPQSGILAVGAATRRPVVDSDGIGTATVMTATLSADHRVVDGAVAARWLSAFKQRIQNPLSLLL